MSRLKTFFILFLALPIPGHATEENLVATFATCAGRFSAELEHAWLMSDERASFIEHRRQQFIDLLDALTPVDQKVDTMNARIHAKHAHWRLLTRATFSSDRDQSEWAVRQAGAEIAYCAGFLLES